MNVRTVATHARATLCACIVGLTTLATACDSARVRSAWRERPDSVGYRTLTGLESACANCIKLSPTVTLGLGNGEGTLEDRGPSLGHVVRDLEGRFWVAQRGAVKVYAPNGEFVRTVGRRGEGPLEFDFAEPMRVDASGMVHVIDLRLGRETIIRPDFTRHSDHTMVGQFDEIAPLPGDENRYVIAKWMATPDLRVMPLHVVSGMDVLHSFGLTPRADTSAVKREKPLTRIGVTPDGYMLSSLVDEYLFDAWNTDGKRVAGFELSGFKSKEFHQERRWAMDNPPPNFVADIASYDDQHVIVITHHRRANWKDLVVERVTSKGIPYVETADGNVSSVYRTRVDVLDLNSASVVASTWYDGWLLRMIEHDVIARLDYNAEGSPLIALFKMTVRVP